MRNCITFSIVLLPILCFSQKYSITGKVQPGDSIGDAFGIQVYIENSTKGTITDESGAFEIKNLSPGDYTLIFSCIGYREVRKELHVTKNVTINTTLLPKEINLDEVVVKSDRLIDRSSVSDISMVPAELASFQGLQEDPLNVVASMPGISKGTGDLFSASQLYVRGGAPDENLFLMDNVKVYWPWYFGGIKSSFNTETIDKLELLTGGFSAKYGNAMSSVIRVTTRDGDFQDFGGNFTFGFSNLQLFAEGPIVKDRLSALVSVRKTYLDFFMGENSSFPVPNLFDITYKTTYKINEKHRLSFSGLSSREKIKYYQDNPVPGMVSHLDSYGTSHNQSLQLRSLWNNRFYSNISIVHALTQNEMYIGKTFSMDLAGDNWGVRNDFTYYINNKHKIDFGIDYNYSDFKNIANQPFNPLETNVEDTTIQYYNLSINSNEYFSGSYISYRGQLFNKLAYNIGARYDFLNFESDTKIHDFSPRLSVKYDITEKTGIRGAYGYFYQNPGDESLLNNPGLESNQCVHYILGIEHSFNSAIKGWAEVYLKEYDNLVVKDSLWDFSNDGKGHTKGAEIFLAKQQGNLQGWFSYALSYAKRQQSLMDKEYFFEYDKRHMLNVSLSYQIDGNKNSIIPNAIAIQFRYESGTPYTPVLGAENVEVQWHPSYGDLLSKRNPAFHTMSLKLNWEIVKTKKLQLNSYFEIWNVYDRKNVMGRDYLYGSQYENNVKTEEYYSIPFMPGGGFKIVF